jgi:hypothetical protein
MSQLTQTGDFLKEGSGIDGLFSSVLWTKLFVVVFLVLSCLGTKGVKQEKIKWSKINTFLFFGFTLFFLNRWLLYLLLPLVVNMVFYVFMLTPGYILLLVAGLWMSCLLKNNLMDDIFNIKMSRSCRKYGLLKMNIW